MMSIDLLFSKTMRTLALVILFLTLYITTSKTDAFSTLVEYQNKQRLSAQIGDNPYHLLPFRVSGTQQDFIQIPQINEFIYVQVQVHWIRNNSVLSFPNFNLSQKVRLTIEEQNIRSVPKRAIISKEFLTQTGFKIQLRAGCSYRWRVQSSGNIQKLVQIAIVKKAKDITSQNDQLKEIHQDEVQTLRSMKQTLEKAKIIRRQRDNKVKQSQLNDMWAWMSGIEMISLLGFLLVQVTLFQKFMLPSSAV